MTENKNASFFHKVDRSALLTIIGVILLFSTSIIVTLIAPRYVDSTWTNPSSSYQVQIYEIDDPHLYLSTRATGGKELQYVHHLKQGFSLMAFQENKKLKILAPKSLQHYVTLKDDPELKLTTKILFLRIPEGKFKTHAAALIDEQSKIKNSEKEFQVLELYDPGKKEAFSLDSNAGIISNWIDENFKILEETNETHHKEKGVIYVLNPVEFRIKDSKDKWSFDMQGEPISQLDDLTNEKLGFYSRKELIEMGEQIYAIEGCWYCHTDQTRTLIQDTVSNGADAYPAPPSSANEYIYQKITFPGTRRIGPDISRTGVRRPSREWHKVHFWSPKTAVIGSIMPSFRHFFDPNPDQTSNLNTGIPNVKFEAIYQYMMTKGTRITPPTQAWWLGKDPVKTIEIIQGKRHVE